LNSRRQAFDFCPGLVIAIPATWITGKAGFMPEVASHNPALPRVAFVGFGEAAQAFWAGWKTAAVPAARAFDIATEIASRQPDKLNDYRRTGMDGAATLAEALRDAEVVFSLLTADNAQAAAVAAAEALPRGALWFDCNSCAPQTKQKSAEFIEEAGGRYVDVAVMAPVHPRLHRTPLLVSGPHCEAALSALRALGMDAQAVSDRLGTASSIKLCRSIMIKGLEALMAECVLSSRQLGVEAMVLSTLEETFPGFDWERRAAGMLERAVVHGRRRSAEMRETAAMIESRGLPGRMSYATAIWQQQIGELELQVGRSDLGANADAILTALNATGRKSRAPHDPTSSNR
jgi:3-hydroxyisobutyrate dehydrogenase-like beta-hydroxyacid dehydrogenase